MYVKVMQRTLSLKTSASFSPPWSSTCVLVELLYTAQLGAYRRNELHLSDSDLVMFRVVVAFANEEAIVEEAVMR